MWTLPMSLQLLVFFCGVNEAPRALKDLTILEVFNHLSRAVMKETCSFIKRHKRIQLQDLIPPFHDTVTHLLLLF